MCYMTKVVGCRISNEIYDKIRDLDGSASDFLRSLIGNYFLEDQPNSIIDVNRSKEGVNNKKIDDESYGY